MAVVVWYLLNFVVANWDEGFWFTFSYFSGKKNHLWNFGVHVDTSEKFSLIAFLTSGMDVKKVFYFILLYNSMVLLRGEPFNLYKLYEFP